MTDISTTDNNNTVKHEEEEPEPKPKLADISIDDIISEDDDADDVGDDDELDPDSINDGLKFNFDIVIFCSYCLFFLDIIFWTLKCYRDIPYSNVNIKTVWT
ncbi:MAG: hypothetical protein M3270_11560 [Thermoproteota archaeon]|nr:hypothetical protein [Thermoproteota archaeon]